MPIFIMFLAALMEFSHVFFVSHMLKAAAKAGARYGSSPGVTTAQCQAKVQQIVGSSIKVSNATVYIKDAAIFDTANVNASSVNYSSLPAMELNNAEQGHLFVVRITVPYDQVALLPPFWVKGRTVTGQSVLRHE